MEAFYIGQGGVGCSRTHCWVPKAGKPGLWLILGFSDNFSATAVTDDFGNLVQVPA